MRFRLMVQRFTCVENTEEPNEPELVFEPRSGEPPSALYSIP